jgi:formylglycine-generating enzyme required for sulfatase activity
MKRLSLLAFAAFALFLLSATLWTVAGLPPVRMVLRHGFSHAPEPTGRTLTVDGIELVEIGPGCFFMGSKAKVEGGDWLGRVCAPLGLPWGEPPPGSMEGPAHWVEFQSGFWIARYEVTNAQWEKFEPGRKRSPHEGPLLPGWDPPAPLGDRHPAVGVSWVEAKRYTDWLAKRFGIDLRLPSEAAWEASCRGGSLGVYCFGDDAQRLPDYAWIDENCGWPASNVSLGTHEVGTRRANAWGLHDFHGNAWEWCEDTFHPCYENAPTDGSPWTEGGVGEIEDPHRVLRGGLWAFDADWCRSARRHAARSMEPLTINGRCWGYVGVRVSGMLGPGHRE